MTETTQPNGQQASNEGLCDRTPIGLLAELTHRCPLQCPYCSNPLELERVDREMDLENWLDVIEQAAKLGILQMHFSGGEPTLRRDLEEMIAKAADVGIYSNLITSGVLLDRDRLERLAKGGLDHLQLSIQDADVQNADRIAAYKNGHNKKMELAKWVRELDMALTINAPIHRQNIDHLEQIIELAVSLGAGRLEVAHVQYYGWAFQNRAALLPTYEQTMWSVDIVEEARARLKGIMLIDLVVPDYYASRPKPCMGGWGSGFMNVTPSGKVLPCHAAESIQGMDFDNIKEMSLVDIWHHSEAFNKFRGTDWMAEPCRSCEFKEVDWGGCRCQAFAFTQDASQTDPACAKSSLHQGIIDLANSEAGAPPKPFIFRNFREARTLLDGGTKTS